MVPFAYSLRSLAVRRATTVTTALGVGLVVFVFCGVQMFSNGLSATLAKSGAPRQVIVLAKGANAELDSHFDERQLGIVFASDKLVREPDGSPRGLTSLVVASTLETADGTGIAPVLLRGVEADWMVREQAITIVAGRLPNAGSDEAIVGEAIRGRFGGLDQGGRIDLPRGRSLTVVGVFACDGAPFESEVWTHSDVLQSAYGLENQVSSALLELGSAEDFQAFATEVDENPQLDLWAVSARSFAERQAGGMNRLITAIALVIAVLFSLAATLGAAITMQAAVANRRREIGVLRALGFSRFHVLFTMLLESTVLTVAGGTIGALGAVALQFIEISMLNEMSRATIVFAFVPTPSALLTGLLISIFMGLLGGAFPAVRAAHVQPVVAMRE